MGMLRSANYTMDMGSPYIVNLIQNDIQILCLYLTYYEYVLVNKLKVHSMLIPYT